MKSVRFRSPSSCPLSCGNKRWRNILHFLSTRQNTATLAPHSSSFSKLSGKEKNRKILLIFIHIPAYPGCGVCVRVWVRVDVRFSSVCTCTRLCVYAECGGASCVIYSSVVAQCEKDDESFRLPFSNRLDSADHQAKGKLLCGASAPCPIDLYASLLIENHCTRFSFRSIAPIALLSENNARNHLSLITYK